jgi:energy-coupling factor transport system ATP-binding protein
VVILAEGDVVADGTTREILTSSPMFAPQTMKVFQNSDWLTVNEAVKALAVPA